MIPMIPMPVVSTTVMAALATALGYITPETYGALGDGTTDDTAAFTAMQADIDAGTFGTMRVVIGKPGARYVLAGATGWVFNTAKAYFLGGGCEFKCSGITSGNKAITLSASGRDALNNNLPSYFANCLITGNASYTAGAGTNYRDFPATGLYCNGPSAINSVHCVIQGVRIQYFQKNISLGSNAYFLTFIDGRCHRGMYGLYQEAGATNLAEGVTFYGWRFADNDCNVNLTQTGNIVRMFGCSIDYFGDSGGTRITANDRLIDLGQGTELELHGCHLEWNYGSFATQTNCPIRLANSNTSLRIFGGFIAPTVNNMLYKSLIEVANTNQMVLIRDAKCQKLGRSAQTTTVDTLVTITGDTDYSTVGSATVIVEGLRSPSGGGTLTDYPATACINGGMQWLRNGIDTPINEIGSTVRCSTSGTVTSQTAPYVGATATVAHIFGLTGSNRLVTLAAGSTYRIAVPKIGNLRTGWMFSIDMQNVTAGTVVVRERNATVITRFNSGATAGELVLDGRTSVSSNLTLNAAATTRHVTWKDVTGSINYAGRGGNDISVIEIDCTGATGVTTVSNFAFTTI